MNAQYQLLWIACCLYGSVFLAEVWRLAQGRTFHRWPRLGWIMLGFLLQIAFLWKRGISEGRCPVSNLFETLSFVATCLVGLHVLVVAWTRLNYLTVFYIPLVLIIQLAALIVRIDPPAQKTVAEGAWLGMHASTIMLGYSVFGLAGAIGAMFLVQDRQLRHHRLLPGFMNLPSIIHLEQALFVLLLSGWSLLTLGLLVGGVGLHVLKPDHHPSDPKFWWSAGIWIFYSLTLGIRLKRGRAGQRIAILAVIGTLFVISTFWLVNLWSSLHKF